MIDTLFVEEKILHNARSQHIISRFPKAHLVTIDRYQEIFNKRSQNFRIQKKNPALILAKKYDNFILPAPGGFGLGTSQNYYFSHMYNCIYDCRYCFLQGMYSSANYLVFVNYDDFYKAIEDTIRANSNEKLTFFSGYDCDSLAFEKVTGFAGSTIPFFKKNSGAEIEFRTKSVNLEPFTSSEVIPNCVVAFSLMPEFLAKKLDKKAPSIRSRIHAIKLLAKKGWPIGLRFDPLIYCENWKQLYRDLISQIMDGLITDKIHSVSHGPLRFPKKMYQNIVKLHPKETLFASPMTENLPVVAYSEDIESEMSKYISTLLAKRISADRIFQCIIGV
tara:strand:+ start:1842 stop:2840 length:999 start_codon:yes stop_codon:yes gene_type:complete